MALGQQELNLFETVIRDFLISIKNCLLYDPGHPLFQYSIDKTRQTIEKWYGHESDLTITVSATQLEVNAQPVEKKTAAFREFASMLHRRGIMSVQIQDTVSAKDLVRFVDLMKLQGREIGEMGGSQAILTPESAIQVQEIDYRSILSNLPGKYSTEEEHVWAYLRDIDKISQSEDLPESKSELLMRFFQDSVKSTTLLNRIYKRALSQKADEKVVETYQSAIMQVCRYLETQKDAETAVEFKSDLLQLISQLHPDLVRSLLEHINPAKQQSNFAETITKDLPDNTIAGFMQSLISNEGSVNEYLLRIFNKLVPDETRTANIAPVLADNLFDSKAIKASELTSIQVSIQELFKNNPEDNFLSEMYRITVDSVMNNSRDSLIVVQQLTPEITRFVHSLESDQLEKERVRLLKSILLHETDPNTFKQFTIQMLESFQSAMKSGDFNRVKIILLFFSRTLNKRTKAGAASEKIRQEALKKMVNPEVIRHMASSISRAEAEDLDELSTTFALSASESINVLLDQYLNQSSAVVQNKMMHIFQKMKKNTVAEVYRRLENCNPQYSGGLLAILQNIAPDKLPPIIRKLVDHESSLVQWEALRRFVPENEEDGNVLLACIRNSKNAGVRKTAITAMLNAKKEGFLRMLFQEIEKRKLKKDSLLEAIELAGSNKSSLAFPYLAAEVRKRTLFDTKHRKNVRFAALKSMMQINPSRTDSFIGEHLADKDYMLIREVRKSLEKPDNEEENFWNA